MYYCGEFDGKNPYERAEEAYIEELNRLTNGRIPDSDKLARWHAYRFAARQVASIMLDTVNDFILSGMPGKTIEDLQDTVYKRARQVAPDC